MIKDEYTRQRLLGELQTKSILTEMKHQLIRTMCNLMDDELYTKNDAVHALLEVVALIELEERKVSPQEFRKRMVM